MWQVCFAVFAIPTAISAALGLLGLLIYGGEGDDGRGSSCWTPGASLAGPARSRLTEETHGCWRWWRPRPTQSDISVSSWRSWPPYDCDDRGREGGDQAGEIGLSPVSNSSYSGGNSIPKRWQSNLTSW
jgi:hypothetical protein